MFGMQANARGGFDYTATPTFSTTQTPGQAVTQQNFGQNLQNLVNQITDQFGQVYDVRTPLSGGYYSERGFEPTFTPIGTAPTFRSGVAGYVPQAELPQGFQFGTNQVVAPTPVFTPGEFNLSQMQNMANMGEIRNNAIIGYSADGQPIFAAPAAPSDGGGG
jgi:hypothetical protein